MFIKFTIFISLLIMVLSILQWNCNGLNSHKGEFKALLEKKIIQPDIVLLQEIRISKKRTINFDNYNIIKKHRQTQTKGTPGGGVMILVKKGIDYQEHQIDTGVIENMCLTANMEKNKQINIINIYIPPNSRTTIEDIRPLNNFITKYTYIGGDFNAHSGAWGDDDKTCTRGKIVENWIRNQELIILNQGQTTRHCIRTGKYTAIDLSLITPALTNQTQWDIGQDSWGSDHFPICTQLDKIYKETPQQYPDRQKYNFNKANWKLFQNICEQKTMANLFEINDIEYLNQELVSIIIAAADESIPLIKGTKQTTVPWWNKQIDEARAKRKQLNKKAKKI